MSANETRRRTRSEIVAASQTQQLAATLGTEALNTRRTRGMTLENLAGLVGLHRTRLGEIEHGSGASASLATWIALGAALRRPLAVSFSRDIVEPRAAGHLEAQELVL